MLQFFENLNWNYVVIASYVLWHMWYSLEGYVNGAQDNLIVAPYKSLMFDWSISLPGGYHRYGRSVFKDRKHNVSVGFNLNGVYRQMTFAEVIEGNYQYDYAKDVLGSRYNFVVPAVVGTLWLLWPIVLFFK